MKLTESFIDMFIEYVYDKINPNDDYRSRKYIDDVYIREILYLLNNGSYWSRHNGTIDGNVLNNKHNQYVKMGLYRSFYINLLDTYLLNNKTTKLKFQSIDSSFIPNKLGIKLGRNKYYKNKRGVKISSIVDVNGVPLSIFVNNGSIHDSKLFYDTFDNMLIVTKSAEYKNHNRYKQYFLADSAYDTLKIKNQLKEKGYIPIIRQNKRNIKNPNKTIKLTKDEKIKYKKRLVVENSYAWIKSIPKMNYVYEKTIIGFEELVFLVNSILLFNKMNK